MELVSDYDIILLASDDMVPQVKGFDNIITRTHAELDLCNQHDVQQFFQEEKPEVVLSMNQIAEKFGISVEQLKITKE